MSRRRTLIAAACGLLMVLALAPLALAPGCTNLSETDLEQLGCPHPNGTYDPDCCAMFNVGCGDPCQPPGDRLSACCDEFDYCRTAPMPWIDGGAYSNCLVWLTWHCDAGAEDSDGGDAGQDLDGGSD